MVKVRIGTEEQIFTVTGGLAEVQPEIVTVLADAAENVEEIDIAPPGTQTTGGRAAGARPAGRCGPLPGD